MKQPVKGSIFPVMCLVAGTCVGGGMLALPVATSLAGFFPALIVMAFAAAFMAITGLLFVEANLWMGKGAHFMTMATHLLGPFGRIVVAILFLFIGYASLVAYTAGGADILGVASQQLFGHELPRWVGCILYVVVFGGLILMGRWVVGRVNAVLFVGMIIAYLALIVGGIIEVTPGMLVRHLWSQGGYALPLLLTIFSYQAIVPSMVIALDGDWKALKKGIIGGVVIAFVIYAFWVAVIFGVVPLKGSYGLEAAFREGVSVTRFFRYHTELSWIAAVAEFFAFFALVTSFLGIGLGLYDFLVDGLHLRGRRGHRVAMTVLIALPSIGFAMAFPRAFLVALDASGGFGDAILNGIIPVLMVWSGRYVKEYSSSSRVAGGKVLLALLLIFALIVLGVEVIERLAIANPLEDLR